MNIKRIVKMICVFLMAALLMPSAIADIEVHFLNVGQGDSAIILCDGEAMMIDGGSSDQSRLIDSYLKNTLHLNRLEYVVATHPDPNCIGGLSAALNACEVGTAFSSATYGDTKAFQSFRKYAQKQGLDLCIPNAGDSFRLGNATVDVLAPFNDDDGESDSVVLRIAYGNISFLFTGDTDASAESAIIENGIFPQSTVLKVSRHGSASASSDRFLDAVQPRYAVISVGKNSDGNPSPETLNRLSDRGIEVFRTDENGTIVCVSDGNTISFLPEKAAAHVSSASESQTEVSVRYIGNHNSKKFHYADCPSVLTMKEENKVGFSDREDAVESGYVPCKRCNP